MRSWTEQLAATVRPLITFGAFGVFAYLACTGRIGADAVLGVIGMVFGFWFQARSQTAPSAAAKETKP